MSLNKPKFKVGDKVKVTGSHSEIIEYQGRVFEIKKVEPSTSTETFDEYYLEDIEPHFYDGELELVSRLNKFELRESVTILTGEFTGTVGEIEALEPKYKKYVVSLGGGITRVYAENELESFQEHDVVSVKKDKDFVSIANEIGEFTQMKNEAYGSSVDATEKIMEVLMERYLNTDTNTYEFPRSLLKHILLQVRIMDKQNRLFSNPDGDKLNESIYKDLTGYGLIGIEMDERNS